MNVGLRNGGGIADSMDPYEFGKDSKFGWKIVFDLTYFILINTIILNIVFGIIVDTFGDMRDEQFRRDEIVENTCLVCLNQKKEILETKNEFDDHIEHQHNIWNYVYFLNYLKHKPLKDLTMAEMEAWDSTRKKLHDWLPLKKSLFLKKIRLDEDQKEDELMINMLSEINLKSNKLKSDMLGTSRKIDDIKKEILLVGTKFNSAVV
jgi:inositol 1,4,5-triphosphate receptor type 1